MNDKHAGGFAEATSLTRAGRLVEATALIQRLLRGDTAPVEEAEAPQAGVGRSGSLLRLGALLAYGWVTRTSRPCPSWPIWAATI